MQIRFVKSGEIPGRLPFELGEISTLPDDDCRELIAAGWAVNAAEPAPAATAAPEARPGRRRKAEAPEAEAPEAEAPEAEAPEAED